MFKIPVKPRAHVIRLKVRTSNFVNEMLDPFAQLFQHCWSHTCANIAVELKFSIKQGRSVRFLKVYARKKGWVGATKAFQIRGSGRYAAPEKSFKFRVSKM